MREMAHIWSGAPFMAPYLDGAKHLAMRLLIELPGCNATQAEQLVDEAIASAKPTSE